MKAKKIKGIDFKESKYTVVYFYPRDNTPGCTIEAKEFTDLIKDFEKLGVRVFGISKDSEKSHCNFIEKHDLKVNLISDEDHSIQEKYGVWQLKKFMGREFMGTVRTTFLIDSKGNIVNSWEKVKAKGHPREVLEFVKKI